MGVDVCVLCVCGLKERGGTMMRTWQQIFIANHLTYVPVCLEGIAAG